MKDRYLSIYLNDHLAMFVAAQELVSRSLQSNQGSDFGRLLETILDSTEQERKAVESLMAEQGVVENRTKSGGAWLAERVGRLKMNGELTGYSDLSRLVETEGIGLALEARRMFWDTICRLGISLVRGMQTRSVARRAEQQMDALETHRIQAAEKALGLRLGSIAGA